MKRTNRHISRLATVLVVAAVSATIAQAAAGANPGSVGLARGVLETQAGFSQARAVSWTTGVCSYQDRPASCYLTPANARRTSIAEARALGTYRGMTTQQAQDWSSGVCSYQDKPSSCYLTPKQAAAQSQALADAMGVPTAFPSLGVDTPVTSSAFSWGDAGIGAGAALGIVLLLAGLGTTIALRQRRREPQHA
jgi:hypothetical protein